MKILKIEQRGFRKCLRTLVGGYDFGSKVFFGQWFQNRVRKLGTTLLGVDNFCNHRVMS